MIKNILAVLVTIAIVLSCSVVAFASGDDMELLPDGGYDVGDVDMDGDISIMDATTIQQYLVSRVDFSDKQLVLADTTFDGTVSIMDATCIQMFLVGLTDIVKPTEPPVEDNDKPIELPFVPAQ